MEKSDRIPDSMHSKFANITSKTDAFCQRYLNDEYRQLVRTAVAALCRKRPSPLLRGSEDFWAAGVIHAIGTANFVFDKSQTPHCNAPDIYSFFGDYICRQDEYATETTVDVSRIEDNLPEIVGPLVAPLYERFSFYQLPSTLVAKELATLRSRRF